MGPAASLELGREPGSALRGLRVHGLGTRELSEGHLLLSGEPEVGGRSGWGTRPVL